MKGNNLVKRITSAILAFALVLTTVVVGNVTTASAAPADKGHITVEVFVDGVKVDTVKSPDEKVGNSATTANTKVAINGTLDAQASTASVKKNGNNPTFTALVAKKGDNKYSVYYITPEAGTIDFKFHEADENGANVSGTDLNDVNYAIALLNSKGEFVKYYTSEENLNFTVNAKDAKLTSALFPEIEGYDYFKCYFNWVSNADTWNNQVFVTDFRNFGSKSTKYNYNSNLGFMTYALVNGQAAEDYTANFNAANVNGFYSYNPTGILRVAYKAKSFTVTFYDEDGVTVLDRKAYDYGSTITVPTPSKASDNQNSYSFVGWDKNVSTICTGAAEYTAVYSATPINYEIKFFNNDGTLLNKDNTTYKYGESIEVPSNPSHVGKDIYRYGFKSWEDKDGNIVSSNAIKASAVSGNATYTAVYDKSLKVAYYKYNNKVDTIDQFYDQDGITGRPVADFKQVGKTQTFAVGANAELETLLNKIFEATKNNVKVGTIDAAEIKAVMAATDTTEQAGAVDCWYVLKQESDGWHIDGGDYNTYDIVVNYVDTDDNVIYSLGTVATKKVGTYTVNAQHSKLTLNGRDYVLGEAVSKEVELTNNGAVVNFVFKKVFKIQAMLDYTLIVDHFADQQRGVDYIAQVIEGEDASAFLSDEALKNMETKYASWLDAGKKFSDEGFQITTADVNKTALDKDVMIVAHRANIIYTVNFYDANKILLSSKEYTYKQTVEIPEATAEYILNGVDYTFSGWDKNVVTEVVANADYFAQYNSSIIDYIVTFEYKDAEGEDTNANLIKNFGDEVDAPEVPDYEDDLYNYTFEAWTVETESGVVVVDEIPVVTEDVTYVATYTATLKTFTVTYEVDGIVVDTFTVDAGSLVAPLLEAEYVPEEGYLFSGWSTTTNTETVLADVLVSATTELIPAPPVIDDRDPEVEGDEDVIEDEEPGHKGEVEADDDVVTADRNTNIGLLISLLGVSAVAIVTLLLKKKSEKNA